eukprot:TRINITY_DN14893_c0_g1_i13.p1 TRINITY_DN14893_c0_g1~~TRINITY_DN14893_c0_g1_i13.p1  ORF type:complete len:529 (-),score=142.82 TRINITY_DN14893_c0_g1_i13:183-1769(-)
MINFIRRMEDFVENVKTKRNNMKEKVSKDELRECTFVPNISQSFFKREARQFIMDKDAYSIRAKINLNKIIAKECPRFSFRPLIDSRSNLIANAKPRANTPVYQRLYELSSRGKGSPVENAKGESVKLRRLGGKEKSLVVRLYEDAKVRDVNLKSRRRALEKVPKKCYSYVSDQHVVNKFLKEFTYCISSLNSNWEKDPWIGFEEMKELMNRMGFTPVSANSDKEKYEILLNKLFTSLDEKDRGKINVEQLRAAIAAILNIALDSKKSTAEVHKLHKEYKLLYLLKKSNNTFFYKQETPNKIKGPVKNRESVIRHVDSLMRIREKQERELTARRREEEEKELSECTFKPKINSYTRTSSNKNLSSFPVLEELSKSSKLKPKRNTNNSKKKIQPTSGHKKAEAVDPMTEKAIERMRKGRQDRERVRNMLERTTDTNYMRFNLEKQPPKPKPAEHTERPKPLLKIEVNIGDKIERVLVYRGDTAESLTRDFAEAHGECVCNRRTCRLHEECAGGAGEGAAGELECQRRSW